MCVKARRPGIIYIMKNIKLKVGDKVKIINTSMIEDYELGKVGTIIEIRTYEFDSVTYTVDIGRPRRPNCLGDNETCWYVHNSHIELVNETGQLLFPFMRTQ